MKILMEQSEKDIRYLTEEFRAKLEEQRKMFGEK